MALGNWLVLRRLRMAIQKVRFLLSSNLTRWLFLGSAAAASSPGRLSFKDQPAGLLDFVSNADSEDYHDAVSSTSGISTRAGSSPSSSISRTTSDASSSSSRSPLPSPDDIDKRAEAFIANFWRHIQMERQVSLELRYCKTNSLDLERTKSD